MADIDCTVSPLRLDGSPRNIKGLKVWHPKSQTPVRTWWSRSYARKVAQEICRFPLRIVAILERPNYCRYCLPPAPDGLPIRSFWESCRRDINSLSGEYPFATELDLQMAARAYQLGCQFALSLAMEDGKA